MESPINLNDARMAREVECAQSKFQRVLVQWAGAVLELRRRGRLLPTWDSTPVQAIGQDRARVEPMNDAA